MGYPHRGLGSGLEAQYELVGTPDDVARPDEVLLGHRRIREAVEDRAEYGPELEAREPAAEADVRPFKMGPTLRKSWLQSRGLEWGVCGRGRARDGRAAAV